jgi:hypothetical protein
MKTKNLMLGIFAFIFAAGTALASTMFLALDTYVWGKTVENSTPHCIFVGQVCNNDGTDVCKISVPLSPSGSVIPTQVFRNSICTLPMTDIRTTTLSTSPQDQITQIVIK